MVDAAVQRLQVRRVAMAWTSSRSARGSQRDFPVVLCLGEIELRAAVLLLDGSTSTVSHRWGIVQDGGSPSASRAAVSARSTMSMAFLLNAKLPLQWKRWNYH